MAARPGTAGLNCRLHAHPHEHGDHTEQHAENDRAMTSTSQVTEAGAERPGVQDAVNGDGRPVQDVDAGIQALWQQFADKPDQTSRDRLVLHYAPLVKYVAGRVGTGLPTHVDVGDLVQSGIFGLVDAIEKFDPERGLRFETYAMQRIRGAILDDLRSQDWVPRAVRSKAKETARALERLGARLHRTPTDAELMRRNGHQPRRSARLLRPAPPHQRGGAGRPGRRGQRQPARWSTPSPTTARSTRWPSSWTRTTAVSSPKPSRS